MTSILTSLNRTIISGTILTLLFIAYFISADGSIDEYFWQFIFRYIHVLAGIMWIGLLYYFNFVQIPNMPKIPDDQKPAIGKVIAPAALWYFRWAAMLHFNFWINFSTFERISTICSSVRYYRLKLKQYCYRNRNVASNNYVV